MVCFFLYSEKRKASCRKKVVFKIFWDQSFSPQEETGRIHRLPTEIHQFVEGNWHMAAQFFVVSIHFWTPKCVFFLPCQIWPKFLGSLDLSVWNWHPGALFDFNKWWMLQRTGPPESDWFSNIFMAMCFLVFQPWEGYAFPKANPPKATPSPNQKTYGHFMKGIWTRLCSVMMPFEGLISWFFWRVAWCYDGMNDERISTKSQRSKMEPVKSRQ